jgi:hypothetical protein
MSMQKVCGSCGVSYEAKRVASRFCSERCRKRAQRVPGHSSKGEQPAAVSPLVEVSLPVELGLVDVISRELGAAGRVDTVLGQQALALAARIVSPRESGGAVASLSKELSRVLADALAGVAVVADPLDELRRRRDFKRSAG